MRKRMQNGCGTERVRLKCGINGTDGVNMRNGTDMGLKCGTERIWG
jgi:hypothetical protein